MNRMRTSGLFVLWLVVVTAISAGPKSRLKQYLSHDSSLVASIFTVIQDGKSDTESEIEFRTLQGKLLGRRSFISKDHAHGLGVVKAEWTLDSKFFVFSTMASGGQMPGNFPTFFFSRDDDQLHALDVGEDSKVTDPEFDLGFPDVLSVSMRRRAAEGKGYITHVNTVRLSELQQK